jgi:hypothetical protein
MNHVLMAVALVLGFLVTGTLADTQRPTAAQDTPTVTMEIGRNPVSVDLPQDEPLVLWVDTAVVTPAGQFARARVMVQTSEGQWVTLTPCDDLMVACETVAMRIDGVTQGEQFYLDLGDEA